MTVKMGFPAGSKDDNYKNPWKSRLKSTFAGDDKHPMPCTDAVTGDHVAFDRTVFTGSDYRTARFAGFERVEGEIICDSYGSIQQQHTFTIRLGDGSEIRIKGRNMYANGLFRAPWPDEDARRAVLAETAKRCRLSF